MGRTYAPRRPARDIFVIMRRFLPIVATAMLAAGPLAAQQPAPAKDGRRLFVLPGLRFGTPAAASLSLGLGAVRLKDFVGPVISVEPGIRAGRASIGHAWIRGNLPTGPAVRASFLRRYSHDKQGNYVGAEVQYVLVFTGPRIGVFRSLRGSRTLFSIDYGLGL
jgi:hypothetical protein